MTVKRGSVHVIITGREDLRNVTRLMTAPLSTTLFVIRSLAGSGHHHFPCVNEEDLPRFLTGLDDDTYVAFVESSLVASFLRDCNRLLRELEGLPRAFVLLANRRKPPPKMRRDDGEVESFVCSARIAEQEWSSDSTESGSLCYRMFTRVVSKGSALSLLVRQLPMGRHTLPQGSEAIPSVVIIIPHGHSLGHLQLTLHHVHRMISPSSMRTAVGLDVDDVGPYQSLKESPNVDIYRRIADSRVGPYVFRQAMIDAAREELILFQDSDDIPCTDRVKSLAHCLTSMHADMVGSHEIEFDQIGHKLKVYRYPLCVSKVLLGRGSCTHGILKPEPFLHGTAMIRRDKFQLAGGLSTNRRIANDTQFLLRAALSLNIVNVDEFLYVRTVHKNALTVTAETRNGSTLRKNLSEQWQADFWKIRNEQMELSESSLKAVAADKPFTITLL
jgi:hypothetical protein